MMDGVLKKHQLIVLRIEPITSQFLVLNDSSCAQMAEWHAGGERESLSAQERAQMAEWPVSVCVCVREGFRESNCFSLGEGRVRRVLGQKYWVFFFFFK